VTPAEILARSPAVIRAHQTESGAYLAAPQPAEYRNCWFRDGAFIADAMSSAGDVESAEAFFGWCCGVLRDRAEHVESLVERHRAGETVGLEEHLHARYTADGREVGRPWSNFQLDGYATWVWALARHLDRHEREDKAFRGGAALSLRYVAEFWPEPCFDWWEERLGVHTATLGAAHAALRVGERWLPEGPELASRVVEVVRNGCVRGGVLRGSLADDQLDASVLACGGPFGLVEAGDPLLEATVRALAEEGVVHGGVHRYPGDTYYGGGEWLLLSALLGSCFAAAGRDEDARAQLGWVAAHATPEGDLPEQAAEHLLTPAEYGPWVERWGPSASPLLWSHATFVTLSLELGATMPEPIHV
jgi:GH15 family glucan-1,4-alpha-glucosidase